MRTLDLPRRILFLCCCRRRRLSDPRPGAGSAALRAMIYWTWLPAHVYLLDYGLNEVWICDGVWLRELRRVVFFRLFYRTVCYVALSALWLEAGAQRVVEVHYDIS